MEEISVERTQTSVTILNKFLTILTTCLIFNSYSTLGSYVVAHTNHYILILCVKRHKKICSCTTEKLGHRHELVASTSSVFP